VIRYAQLTQPLNLQKFFGCLPGRREAEEWLRKAEEWLRKNCSAHLRSIRFPHDCDRGNAKDWRAARYIAGGVDDRAD
jgi:hypothetical protein